MIARALFAAVCLGIPAQAAAGCAISASGVAFGTYDMSATSADDATGTITITCSILSGLGGYTIALSPGGGGSYAARRMTSGTATLPYQLYADPARTQIWGDGSGGSTRANSIDVIPLLGGSSTYQLYGRIAARLSPRPGAYSDTIVITVSY
ncbi:Csu type fimbrial protein [Sphingomonas sp. PAMC 26617]|uniref:Csu type fimbrial protein n=1 Tax=Sphingomonas sp. PAMC 26617 TaxID=1112216 RepID=UPI00028A16C4|nr:spore coat U domain-containing protein [Sphingomonas sp. PAMC 26617]